MAIGLAIAAVLLVVAVFAAWFVSRFPKFTYSLLLGLSSYHAFGVFFCGRASAPTLIRVCEQWYSPLVMWVSGIAILLMLVGAVSYAALRSTTRGR
jgi:hypothetical protein